MDGWLAFKWGQQPLGETTPKFHMNENGPKKKQMILFWFGNPEQKTFI